MGTITLPQTSWKRQGVPHESRGGFGPGPFASQIMGSWIQGRVCNVEAWIIGHAIPLKSIYQGDLSIAVGHCRCRDMGSYSFDRGSFPTLLIPKPSTCTDVVASIAFSTAAASFKHP